MDRVVLKGTLKITRHLVPHALRAQPLSPASRFRHCPPTLRRTLLRQATFKPSNLRQMINPIVADTDLDVQNYTSGRWLRRDKLERESRFIRFDFDALCRRVVELCPGASYIASYDKKEGGFNRVFIFQTNNAKRIVARLPFALAGPSRLKTNSEVATIKYLQAKTRIPIPSILDWSDDPSNAIGSEYIIMEHAHGISLHEMWPSMDVGDQLKCIKSIYQQLKEVVELDFPAYGCLYFGNSPHIIAPMVPLDEEFCIGPHCGALHWNCDPGQPRYYHQVKPNQGPWQTLPAYCDGLIDTGISRIPPPGAVPKRPRYQGSIQMHHELLAYGRAVIEQMAKDLRIQNAASQVLFHPDLRKRNIFVSAEDPTMITAFIDWQSASIEPAFWYADEVPDFAQPIPDPSSEDQIEPKSEACAKAHDICTRVLVPKLSEPRSFDEALFRPFRYCYRTWADGAAAFHEELIQTSRHWNELGLLGSCPFPLPSFDEIAVHSNHYKLFEAAQQLKHVVSTMLNTASDGWVPAADWVATQSAHKELFKAIREEILGNENPDDDEPIRSETDLREIWPFDLED